MTNHNDELLDDLFATARTADPVPDPALMARVLGDARDVQAAFEVTSLRPSIWARMLDALGGWPAVGGLATATIVGVWIGVAPPQPVSDITAALLGDEVSVSLMSVGSGFDIGAFADG